MTDTDPKYRYTAALANELELRWQGRWEAEELYRQANPGEPGFDGSKPKCYVLDMFPYPSGAGLHVGHPEGYTATDIYSRYKRMTGHNVLHPMGWDAFGLPAEQYAIQTGVHPAITTKKAIDNFRRQLKRFGFSYDWSREFGTIDEDYYTWTQWIFLRLYHSWFDAERGAARPISELEAEFEAGRRPVRFNPKAAEVTAAQHAMEADWEKAGCEAWTAMEPGVRHDVLASYRLAYLAEQTVNWCPKLGTALANEEVIDGRSERGGFPVYRKPLRQWMLRITAYADRLLDGLKGMDWPESTKTQQAEWIGRSEGAEVEFAVAGVPASSGHGTLPIYTTRPDTMFGATYMVVAPEHPLVDAVVAGRVGVEAGARAAVAQYAQAARNRSDVERQESKQKTGVPLGVDCINPANGARIPVWAADYVLMGYGTGAIMAVPAQDERDWEFAEAFGLPIVRTVTPPAGWEAGGGKAFTGDGPAMNSANAEVDLNGLGVADAKARMIDWLERTGKGTRKVNFRLRDWLFSRQRYWGEPFPIVFDEHGRHHAIGDAALPLKLPPLADYQPVESVDPQPLLAKATDWLKTTAGEAGVPDLPASAEVTRETNTMPGWAGSCWYHLRYCDAKNSERFVGVEAERYWMGGEGHRGTEASRHQASRSSAEEKNGKKQSGVDLYVGGSEHAVLHLLYARFWHMVLFDLGHVSTPEPYGKLFHQGLILSHAYQRADKSLVAVDAVENRGTDDEPRWVEKGTEVAVTQVVAKMSKSLKNVVNPDEVIESYGADTFRLYEMYMGPLEASKPWDTRAIEGMFRFLRDVWRLCVDDASGAVRLAGAADADLEKRLHRTVHKVGGDVERLAFNTAIAAMIEFKNAALKKVEGSAGALTADQAERFMRCLAPFAPHLAEEVWDRLGLRASRGSVHSQAWPTVDDAMLRDDEVEVPVQINGKLRGKVVVPAGADAAAMEAIARADPRIAELLEGKAIRKVIAVPGRLVNIVAG